jgi:hypothetical protein
MRSWGIVRLWSNFDLLKFASDLRAVRLHEMAAVAALVACFAVVLNVGPFAKAPKREAQRATAAAYGSDVRDIFRLAVAKKSVGATPVALLSAGTAVQATNLSERFKPLGELAPASDGDAARALAQAVKPVASDADLQAAKPARQDGADQAPRPHATVVGVWAPDTGACSARDFRDGMLPTVINAKEAWAGETFCVFKKKQATKSGWRVVANCSNLHEHWTADARLTVSNNRLTWTSKRGTQTYTRCAPGFLMTAAR